MLQINSSYFSKIALVGVQYESVSLDENKICFDEKQDIPNTRGKSGKIQSVTKWCRCGKYGVMDTNVEYLSCGIVEALRYEIWHTVIGIWSPKEFLQLYLNLNNLNT